MSNFGDINADVSIGASQSIRRNAGDTAYEAFTPSGNNAQGLFYSGKWMGFNCATYNVGSGWDGLIYTTPYIVRANHTVTDIRIPITTGVALGTVRLALYTDLNGYPDALIEDSGDLTATGAGEISFTFTTPVLLNEAIYHMCLQTSSATIASRYWTAGNYNLPRTSGAIPFVSYKIAQAYGAYPSTFAGSATEAASSNQPMLELQAQ